MNIRISALSLNQTALDWQGNFDRISAAIESYVAARSCAGALSELFKRFKGFHKEFGRNREDLFRSDPPFSLLIDLAANYDDEEAFVRDLKATRVTAASKSSKTLRDSASVSLLTAFRAKGREFDTVIILDANESYWPFSLALQEGRLEAERRLFYVAVTRAQANLLFFSSSLIHGGGLDVSRFLRELKLDPSAMIEVRLPDRVLVELISLYPAA